MDIYFPSQGGGSTDRKTLLQMDVMLRATVGESQPREENNSEIHRDMDLVP